MKAKEFDKKFDDGEDVSQYLDVSKARRPIQEQKRVNVDFPLWMIQLLDKARGTALIVKDGCILTAYKRANN